MKIKSVKGLKRTAEMLTIKENYESNRTQREALLIELDTLNAHKKRIGQYPQKPLEPKEPIHSKIWDERIIQQDYQTYLSGAPDDYTREPYELFKESYVDTFDLRTDQQKTQDDNDFQTKIKTYYIELESFEQECKEFDASVQKETGMNFQELYSTIRKLKTNIDQLNELLSIANHLRNLDETKVIIEQSDLKEDGNLNDASAKELALFLPNDKIQRINQQLQGVRRLLTICDDYSKDNKDLHPHEQSLINECKNSIYSAQYTPLEKINFIQKTVIPFEKKQYEEHTPDLIERLIRACKEILSAFINNKPLHPAWRHGFYKHQSLHHDLSASTSSDDTKNCESQNYYIIKQ